MFYPTDINFDFRPMIAGAFPDDETVAECILSTTSSFECVGFVNTVIAIRNLPEIVEA